MRIVVLGDSLALPRSADGEETLWEDTWPALLARSLDAEVINCATRARTIDTLVTGPDFDEHVVLKRPDVLVLQIGVVDCAPRIFSRREQRLMELLHWRLRQLLIDYRRKRRQRIIARDPLARVYTRPDDFARHLETFANRLRGLAPPPRTIVLPIVGDARMDGKSPGFGASVARYNELLRTFCVTHGHAWIAPAEIAADADAYCSDGYHLSRAGNRVVATHLATMLAGRSSEGKAWAR